MPNSSISVEVGEIEDSHGFPGFTDETGQELVNYVSFRQGTHSNYSDTADDDHAHAFQEMMTKSAHYVQHEMPTEVLRTRDDDQSILELATREWTGYGTPENRDSALERWSSLVTTSSTVSRRIRARAHSCLAAGWFERATEDNKRWNIDSLYRAGSNGNEAISLGLFSLGALRAGSSIESQGFRRPQDNRFPGLDTDRFERLEQLWEAIDMRKEEVKRASAKKDAKASRAPLKYVCSTGDCGIQATKTWGLLRCAGKCPVVFKPSYCSKECQSMDWKKHKPFCKADATKSSVDCLNAGSDTADTNAVQRATPSEEIDSDKFEGRRPGHSIDVPTKNGSTTRVNSKTLGPKTMKELRKIAEDNQNR